MVLSLGAVRSGGGAAEEGVPGGGGGDLGDAVEGQPDPLVGAAHRFGVHRQIQAEGPSVQIGQVGAEGNHPLGPAGVFILGIKGFEVGRGKAFGESSETAIVGVEKIAQGFHGGFLSWDGGETP
jgi:hypothetical protein